MTVAPGPKRLAAAMQHEQGAKHLPSVAYFQEKSGLLVG